MLNESMEEEKIILENTKLIYYVIKKMNLYWKTDDEYQEYYDDGMIGLIKGVKTFDESKEVKLSTYLYQCISHTILQGLRRKTSNKNNANNNTFSLNTIITDGKEQELYEIIPDERVDIEKEIEQKTQLEAIYKTLEELDSNEALIFKMFYGLDGYEQKRQKEIAEELKITQSYVSRIIKKSTEKIKLKVENKEREILMKETMIEKDSGEIISFVEKEDTNKNILEQVNSILIDQLNTLKKLDLRDKENSRMEIARSNAVSSTSKIILQTIGIQMMAEKQKYKFLQIEND